jgi:vitamin B12 transporter
MTLPAGHYRLVIRKASFLPQQMDLTLSAGELRTIDVRLELATMSSSVIVTGQALPTSEAQNSVPTDVITRREIEDRQAVSIPDVLQYSPGVAIGRTGAMGGTASVFIDGGNSAYTKVLVDGSPINPPGGAVDFSSLTTDNIDKVEVVRGAESAMYGSDAVSGVVQLFTHRGSTRIPAASVFMEGGSYSAGYGGAQISGLFDSFDYSGAASYWEANGQGPNDKFINRTISGNFGYSLNANNQLRLSLRNNQSDAGIAGQTEFTPPSLYQQYHQHLFTANARWDFATGQHWHYQLMGTEAYTRQHSYNPQQSFYATDPNAFCPQSPSSPNAVPTAEFCDYVYDSLYNYNRAGFNGQAAYVLQKISLAAGYQYEVENGYIYYLEQGHVRRNNQGGFLDLRYSPVSRLSLDVAARAEANDYFGTRVVPRAGGNYALRYGKGFWGDTRLRAFYGQGIKEPRFDQTYGTDPCDPGNLSLKPESSKTWSAGVDQKIGNDRVKLSADYFSNRFYDIVSFSFCSPLAPCPGTPPPQCPSASYGTYFNTDKARARGTHIIAEARAASWLFISGYYEYDDSRILVSPNAFDPSLLPGNRLARRPANSGAITFTSNYRRFSATFSGYFSGERTDSDFLGLGLSRNPGYARFDLTGRYAFQNGFSIYGRAMNLFDKQYQDALGYPALGRDLRIGVRYQFAGRN